MRPTPAQTAAALKRMLEEWAGDETQSAHMRWMLRRAAGVLAQTDWEDASAAIAAANLRLVSTLEAASAWIEGLEPPVAEQYASARRLLRAAGTAWDRLGGSTSLRERNEVNETLRDALETFVAALEGDRGIAGHGDRRRRGRRVVMGSLDDL